MKKSALLVLSLVLLTGCGEQALSVPATIVEEASIAAGSDGKLIQAIGIETLGGVFTPLHSKGVDLPCKVSEVFTTAVDNQSQIVVKLYRGNANLVNDCYRLGEFQVVGVPPAPRGNPQIEITLVVQDGNILLSARDLVSGRAMHINKIESAQSIIGSDA